MKKKKILNQPIRTVIQTSLPSLTGQKKRLAQFLIDNWEDVIYMGIADLSVRSDTSTATITRLYRDFGYTKYSDFKTDITRNFVNKQTVLNDQILDGDDMRTIVSKVYSSEIEALKSTFEIMDYDALNKAVELLVQAVRLDVYGFGGSGVIVQDVYSKFIKIGRFCTPVVDNDLQALSAALLGPRDVVLAISHTGRNNALLYNLEVAKATGATIIAITNSSNSPIWDIADVILCTKANETAFKSDALSSRLAQLFIIDSLYVGMAYHDFNKSYENILKGKSATLPKKTQQKGNQ